MRAKAIIMTAALALLIAAALTAQPGRPPGAGQGMGPAGPGGGPGGPGGPGADLWQGLAADFDADQDGVITLEEFGNAETTFNRLDRNADGVLTAADFEGRFRGRRGPRMRRPMGGRILFAADADGDRVITSAEWTDFLAALDANGDGLIQEDEIHAVMSRGDGFRRPEGERPHAGGFLDRDEDGVLEVEDFEALFATLDDNGDGEVTGEELPRPAFGRGGPGRGPGRGFPGAMLAFFADADGDGEVTGAEWQVLVDSIDGDGNGVIEEAEWTAAAPDPPGRGPRPGHFERVSQALDRNDNDILEAADLAAIFDELDADGNGVIDAEELPGRRWGRR